MHLPTVTVILTAFSNSQLNNPYMRKLFLCLFACTPILVSSFSELRSDWFDVVVVVLKFSASLDSRKPYVHQH